MLISNIQLTHSRGFRGHAFRARWSCCNLRLESEIRCIALVVHLPYPRLFSEIAKIRRSEHLSKYSASFGYRQTSCCKLRHKVVLKFHTLKVLDRFYPDVNIFRSLKDFIKCLLLINVARNISNTFEYI